MFISQREKDVNIELCNNCWKVFKPHGHTVKLSTNLEDLFIAQSQMA